MPEERGVKHGVRLFNWLAEAANRGDAVGISYAVFLAYLHGAQTFQDLAGRNYLPSDSDVAVRAALAVTNMAGGRKEIARSGHSVLSGMDTFIWSSKSPFDRTARAWQHPLSVLPYTREQWRCVFPDGERRLITAAELRLIRSLTQPH
jgi:hypothetical protein